MLNNQLNELIELILYLHYNIDMSRIFLILAILLMSLTPVPAEEQIRETYKLNGQVEFDDNPVETIYLDDTIERPQVNIPQQSLTLPVGVLNITTNANTQRSALARAMISRNSLGDILPLNGSVVAQTGGFSYGSTWGEELSYSQLEGTTSFFVKYDFSKKYSLETAFRQSANRGIDGYYTSVRVTPEWRITDRLTIKDSFSNYVQSRKNKNELTIVYSPELKKYADSLKFELGVAQSFYSNGNRSESVSFTTGFKL
jgi:hypothetical protein